MLCMHRIWIPFKSLRIHQNGSFSSIRRIKSGFFEEWKTKFEIKMIEPNRTECSNGTAKTRSGRVYCCCVVSTTRSIVNTEHYSRYSKESASAEWKCKKKRKTFIIWIGWNGDELFNSFCFFGYFGFSGIFSTCFCYRFYFLVTKAYSFCRCDSMAHGKCGRMWLTMAK